MKKIVPDPPPALPGQRRDHQHDFDTQQILQRVSSRVSDKPLINTLKETSSIPAGRDSVVV